MVGIGKKILKSDCNTKKLSNPPRHHVRQGEQKTWRQIVLVGIILEHHRICDEQQGNIDCGMLIALQHFDPGRPHEKVTFRWEINPVCLTSLKLFLRFQIYFFKYNYFFYSSGNESHTSPMYKNVTWIVGSGCEQRLVLAIIVKTVSGGDDPVARDHRTATIGVESDRSGVIVAQNIYIVFLRNKWYGILNEIVLRYKWRQSHANIGKPQRIRAIRTCTARSDATWLKGDWG